MTINDEILILANKLANQGKKPTVALIKTKLNKKVPLPVIISTLKTWQHDPLRISLPLESKETINESSELPQITNNFGLELHKELTSMRQDISELKLLVQQLLDQQKL